MLGSSERTEDEDHFPVNSEWYSRDVSMVGMCDCVKEFKFCNVIDHLVCLMIIFKYHVLHGKISIIINLPLFSTVLPSNSCCFCPVGLSLLIQHFQQVLWVLKLILSLGLAVHS